MAGPLVAVILRYLLDTNVCIDLLKGRSPGLDARLRQCGVGEVGLSAITAFELTYEAHRSSRVAQNLRALTAFYLPLVIVPFDAMAAMRAGELRAALERAGTPIGPNEMLIAAQALALDVTLVTDNEREFRRVAGLRVENWLHP